jgi:hypothetical protein
VPAPRGARPVRAAAPGDRHLDDPYAAGGLKPDPFE